MISSTTDGSVAFEIIKAYFEPKTEVRIISLLDKFFSLRFDPDSETIGIFGARFKQVVSDLEGVGHELKPLYQGFQVIRYLPPEFSSIVQAIYRWDDTQFTFDNIVRELILEEDRLGQVHRDLDASNSLSGAYDTTVRGIKKRVITAKILNFKGKMRAKSRKDL